MCDYCNPDKTKRKAWRGTQPYDNTKCEYRITETADGSSYMNASGVQEFVSDIDVWREQVIINIPINHCPNCGRKL